MFKSTDDQAATIPSQLKVAVIREELVALTGDALHAVVLNQFIYWSERIRDHDQFILEEQQRQLDSVLPLRHGWIYKRASDLIIETMLGMSDATMRRIIKALVEQKWISERTNPDNKWDEVLQYRINIVKIQYDLQQLGYGLNGFKLLAATCDSTAATNTIVKPSIAVMPLPTTGSKYQSRASNLQNKTSNLQFETSKLQIDASKLQQSCFSSETITKITPETSSSAVADGDMIIDEEDVSIKMIEMWNVALADQVSTTIHATRRQRLTQVLADVFAGDLQAWQAFCQQVATTPFLRGQGPNGWKARLDWCLADDKAQRILEGQYAHCWKPDGLVATTSEQSDEAELLAQCQAVLATEGDQVLRAFKQQLLADNGLVLYQRWFQDLQLKAIQHQTLILSHPKPYSRQQCQQRFQLDLLRAAQQLWPHISKVQVSAPQSNTVLGRDEAAYQLGLTVDELKPEHSGHPVMNARL